MKKRLVSLLFFWGMLAATTASAKEPGWSGTIDRIRSSGKGLGRPAEFARRRRR